jgi:hypothetical protein
MSRVTASLALAIVMALPPVVVELPAPSPESHCVVVVIGQEESGELVTADPTCFETESSARAWAGSSLALAAGAGLGADSMEALTTFTLGTHYDGFNGTGSSISIIGSSCTGGWWNTPPAWDNRISSSYHGCAALRHYDLPDKGGSVQLTTGAGTIKNLSSLNNRTESVSYSAS